MSKTYSHRAQPALFNSVIPPHIAAKLQEQRRELVAKGIADAEAEGRARRARLLRAAESWEAEMQGCTRLKRR